MSGGNSFKFGKYYEMLKKVNNMDFSVLVGSFAADLGLRDNAKSDSTDVCFNFGIIMEMRLSCVNQKGLVK